jgi:hypothetical protein
MYTGSRIYVLPHLWHLSPLITKGCCLFTQTPLSRPHGCRYNEPPDSRINACMIKPRVTHLDTIPVVPSPAQLLMQDKLSFVSHDPDGPGPQWRVFFHALCNCGPTGTSLHGRKHALPSPEGHPSYSGRCYSAFTHGRLDMKKFGTDVFMVCMASRWFWLMRVY